MILHTGAKLAALGKERRLAIPRELPGRITGGKKTLPTTRPAAGGNLPTSGTAWRTSEGRSRAHGHESNPCIPNGLPRHIVRRERCVQLESPSPTSPCFSPHPACRGTMYSKYLRVHTLPELLIRTKDGTVWPYAPDGGYNRGVQQRCKLGPLCDSARDVELLRALWRTPSILRYAKKGILRRRCCPPTPTQAGDMIPVENELLADDAELDRIKSQALFQWSWL